LGGDRLLLFYSDLLVWLFRFFFILAFFWRIHFNFKNQILHYKGRHYAHNLRHWCNMPFNLMNKNFVSFLSLYYELISFYS
jgi:hypothetical protein